MTFLMRVAALSVLVLGVSTHTVAQTVSSTTGAVYGTVTDNTRAVLPGVTVTLSGAAVMGVRSHGQRRGWLTVSLARPRRVHAEVRVVTGFGPVIRAGHPRRLGFTATVNAEINRRASPRRHGQRPVAGRRSASTNVATHFDKDSSRACPARATFGRCWPRHRLLSMGRVDVGGSGALTQQPYTAYGLTSAGGVNRAEVEGIMVNEGAGGGGSDMYYTTTGPSPRSRSTPWATAPRCRPRAC